MLRKDKYFLLGISFTARKDLLKTREYITFLARVAICQNPDFVISMSIFLSVPVVYGSYLRVRNKPSFRPT